MVSETKKTGWKTSEFWMTVAASLIAILNQAFDWKIPTETITQFVGAVAAYVLGRSVMKITGDTKTK